MNNQLEIIVKDSGLEIKEGQTLLEKFGNYEQIAKDWEVKAKMIVVTDASQETEMAMAKTALKKFAELRINVEKERKAMKEQSLRKGQAIDAVAKFLVSLISPIEEHLKLQANFVKIKEEREALERKLAEDKRLEEERVAKEQAEKEEQERVRLENIRLKEEADAREKKMEEERLAAEKKQKELEDKAKKDREEADAKQKELEEKAKKDRQDAEDKLKQEQEKAAKERQEAQDKLDEEKKRAEDEKKEAMKKLAEQEEELFKQRQEAQRIAKEKLDLESQMIECPKCHHKFNN